MKTFYVRILIGLLLIFFGIVPAVNGARISQTGWIAFVADLSNDSADYQPQVYLLDPDDGSMRLLSDYEQTGLRYDSLSWSPDGSTLVFEAATGLYRLSLDGTIQPLLLEKSEFVRFVSPHSGYTISGATRTPTWSPDSQWIAFVHSTADLEANTSTHRLYLLDTTLPGTQHLSDLTSLTDIAYDQWVFAHFAWSPDGQQIVFTPNQTAGSGRFDRVNIADGVVTTVLETPDLLPEQPIWSLDGEWIFFNTTFTESGSGKCNIYRVHPDGTDLQPLVAGSLELICGSPVESPDQQWIAFWGEYVNASSYSYLYRMRADGSDLQRLTIGSQYMPLAWSPDGQWLAYIHDCQQDGEIQQCLYRISVYGGEPQVLVQARGFSENSLSWALVPDS